MRRKIPTSLGKPSPLALVIGAPSVDSYLTGVQPVSHAPASPAAAAVASKEETVDVPTGGDWPQRPEGVSEQDLLNEWLRLHTPKASVSGKKLKDGTVKRTPVSYSNIVLPRGTSLGDTVIRQDVYATSLKERMARIDASSKSRYRTGAARGKVEEFVNKKASKYVRDAHASRVSVWKDVANGLRAKAYRDSESYDFMDRIEARQLEYTLEQHDVTGLSYMQAANDASVSQQLDQFVGPVQPVSRKKQTVDMWDFQAKTYNDYIERHMQQIVSPETLMNKVEARKYNARRRELEEAFREHVVEQEVAPVKADKFKPVDIPTSLAPLNEWREKLEDFFYNTNDQFVFRGNELCLGWIKRERRALLKQWNEAKGHKWIAQRSRIQQFQYHLRSLRNKGSVTSAKHQPMSREQFVKLSSYGSWLPQVRTNTYFEESADVRSASLRSRFHYYKLRKAELTQTFAPLLDKLSGTSSAKAVQETVPTPVKKQVTKVTSPAKVTQFTDYLKKVFNEVVADSKTTKTSAKVAIENAFKEFQQGGFELTNSGLLLPANRGVA